VSRVNHLKRLVAHMAWADRLMLDALRRAGAVDPAVVNLYAHLLAAEHVWLSRLEGRTPAVPVWPTLSLAECERLSAENARGLARYVEELAPDDLDRGVRYKNSAGAEFTSTVEDIVLQVALHGSYHRGQITTALRTAGAIPNPTDFIAFTRGVPAATRVDPAATRSG
jgi:uncharacterized damage-inducible protein DinB